MTKKRKYRVTYYRTPSRLGADLADLCRGDVTLYNQPKNNQDMPWFLALAISQQTGYGIQVETYKEIKEAA